MYGDMNTPWPTVWSWETHWEALTYTGSAVFDPALPFRIVDLSTNEQSPENVTNIANWEPLPGPVPVQEVRVVLPSFAGNQTFTVHSQVPWGPVMHQSVVGVPQGYFSSWAINYGSYFWAESSALVTFSAPEGASFWITNDSGGRWPGGEGTHTVPDSSLSMYHFDGLDFPQPPPPPSIAVTLRINAESFYNPATITTDNLSTHHWQLWTNAGMIAESNASYGINSFAAGNETITTEQGQQIDNPISIITLTAQVPEGVDWWVIDGTTGQTMPIGQSDFFNGWMPHIPLPVAASSLDIHSERLSPQGFYAGYISIGIAPTSFQSTRDTSSIRWISGLMLNGATPAGSTVQYDREFWNEQTYEYYTLPYTHLEYDVPGEWGASYLLVIQNDIYSLYYQSYLGEEIALNTGPTDDTTWLPAPQTVYLNISESRWGHDLVLRHVDGREYPIYPGQTQGDTSWNPGSANHAWVNSYYYFSANTQATPGMAWYIVDKTVGDSAGYGQTNLVDWIVLTAPEISSFGENGFGSINVAVTAQASQTAAIEIERSIDGGPWAMIFGTGIESQYPGTTWWTQYEEPYWTSTHRFRARTAFGGRYSQYSAIAQGTFTPADSDGDGMSDRWEIAAGLDPNYNDSGYRKIGTGMAAGQMYQNRVKPESVPSGEFANKARLKLWGTPYYATEGLPHESHYILTWDWQQNLQELPSLKFEVEIEEDHWVPVTGTEVTAGNGMWQAATDVPASAKTVRVDAPSRTGVDYDRKVLQRRVPGLYEWFNFRIATPATSATPEIRSNETETQVRIRTRTASITRMNPCYATTSNGEMHYFKHYQVTQETSETDGGVQSDWSLSFTKSIDPKTLMESFELHTDSRVVEVTPAAGVTPEQTSSDESKADEFGSDERTRPALLTAEERAVMEPVADAETLFGSLRKWRSSTVTSESRYRKGGDAAITTRDWMEYQSFNWRESGGGGVPYAFTATRNASENTSSVAPPVFTTASVWTQDEMGGFSTYSDSSGSAYTSPLAGLTWLDSPPVGEPSGVAYNEEDQLAPFIYWSEQTQSLHTFSEEYLLSEYVSDSNDLLEFLPGQSRWADESRQSRSADFGWLDKSNQTLPGPYSGSFELPAIVAQREYRPGWHAETLSSHTLPRAGFGYLHLKQGEYWIERNDCLEPKALVFAEWEVTEQSAGVPTRELKKVTVLPADEGAQQTLKQTSNVSNAATNKSRVLELLPIEVVELSPKTKDEDGNDIAGSEKPSSGRPLTQFVETDPKANKIAHREIKVKIGDAMKDKKVTWTLEALRGATRATIRGQWEDSPTHKDRFEASTAYGTNGFRRVSQASGETTVGADGHTAIRVNVPPIGFNQVRIKIQIESMTTPIDLIDMEVPGVVIIDPGHGDRDSGAVGRTDNAVLEKDLALAYSLSLRQKVIDKFAAEKQGLMVVMTRKTTDKYMDNTLRAELARDKGADVFLSIHFNYAASAVARGTEYVSLSARLQVNATEDDQLGATVQRTTLAAVAASDAGARHREPKYGSYYALKDTGYGNTAQYHPIRGVIIEVEFLSHETALETVKLSNATGAAIKTKFAADVSTDIYNNILNQP